jgi:hypothetical protein
VPEQRGASGVLVAGTVEIEYTCCGCGTPVLVLARTEEPDLRAALAARCRLIAPRLPPTAADLEAWFHALIDGLGLVRVHVVVAGEALAELARIAREDPERVARLDVVPRGAGASEVAPLLAALDATRRCRA